MAKVTEITEHFQHFVGDLQDSFWGDVYGRMRVAWQQFWNGESLRARDQWMELDPISVLKERGTIATVSMSGIT